jgi:hypothetical protein
MKAKIASLLADPRIAAHHDGSDSLGVIVRQAVDDDPDCTVDDVLAIICEAEAETMGERVQSIVTELREVVPDETMQAYVDDQSGNDSLDQYRSIVKTRLGGDYSDDAWGDACDMLRGDG